MFRKIVGKWSPSDPLNFKFNSTSIFIISTNNLERQFTSIVHYYLPQSFNFNILNIHETSSLSFPFCHSLSLIPAICPFLSFSLSLSPSSSLFLHISLLLLPSFFISLSSSLLPLLLSFFISLSSSSSSSFFPLHLSFLIFHFIVLSYLFLTREGRWDQLEHTIKGYRHVRCLCSAQPHVKSVDDT